MDLNRNIRNVDSDLITYIIYTLYFFKCVCVKSIHIYIFIFIYRVNIKYYQHNINIFRVKYIQKIVLQCYNFYNKECTVQTHYNNVLLVYLKVSKHFYRNMTGTNR